MKFNCEKNVILKEISIAHEIISSRNALSILSNVMIEAIDDSLIIKATDLKVGFETKIPVYVETEGSTSVFCDKFLGILRSLPDGEVNFTLKDNEKLLIKPVDKKIDFQLKTISSEKFPEIQNINEEHFFEFPQKDFIEMISQTVFSISDDETRYFMNGVFMEKNGDKIIMVATDGRRLSYISETLSDNIEDFSGIIIPSKILNLVKKLSSGEGNLSIAVSEKTLYVKFDNQKVYSTLIDGQFPNYNRVIPDSQEYSITINKKDFSDALKRVSLLAEQKSKRIFLSVSGENISLKSEESDIGVAKEDFSCVYNGPDLTIALNCQYLQDPLRVITDDEISIDFTESNRAITLNSVPQKNFFHIIMPMQMD